MLTLWACSSGVYLIITTFVSCFKTSMVLWTYHRVDGEYAYFVGQHYGITIDKPSYAGIFYTFPDDTDCLLTAGSMLWEYSFTYLDSFENLNLCAGYNRLMKHKYLDNKGIILQQKYYHQTHCRFANQIDLMLSHDNDRTIWQSIIGDISGSRHYHRRDRDENFEFGCCWSYSREAGIFYAFEDYNIGSQEGSLNWLSSMGI